MNIVETTSRKRLSSISNPNSKCKGRTALKKIIETYKNHSSVVTMRKIDLANSLSFDLPPASKEESF